MLQSVICNFSSKSSARCRVVHNPQLAITRIGNRPRMDPPEVSNPCCCTRDGYIYEYRWSSVTSHQLIYARRGLDRALNQAIPFVRRISQTRLILSPSRATFSLTPSKVLRPPPQTLVFPCELHANAQQYSYLARGGSCIRWILE